MKTFNKIILDTDKKLKNDEIITVELSIDDRIKSRIIATTKDGQEVGILTARGTTLRDGTLLSNDDSEYLKVVAALENVSTVRASTPIALTALAYHLGNRHVPLQIDESGFLRYQTDHVLDDMVVKLGGVLVHEQANLSLYQELIHTIIMIMSMNIIMSNKLLVLRQ